MCRSRHESGGPRSCPSHARSQLNTALAELAEQEILEETLFRAACARAVQTVQQSGRANAELRESAQLVESLRWEAAERGVTEDLLVEYRDAYRQQRADRRSHTLSHQQAADAVRELQAHREQAHRALVFAGVEPARIEDRLHRIERDTDLAPPF